MSLRNLLDEFPIDSAIAGDECDYFRYLIDGTLAEVDVDGMLDHLALPFFAFFERTMKDKLLKAGFKKSIIENEKRLETTIKNLNKQGCGNAYLWTKDWLPYGFPPSVVTFGKDNKKLYWIEPDIGAALLALQSIATLKDLLINNGAVNKEAIKVYLNTLQLTVNLTRASNIPMLAIAELDKRKKSLATRELKKEVMRAIIDNIFKEYPHRPKTLGEVWNKIDRGHGGVSNRKTKKVYIAKTSQDAKGNDIVIITGVLDKPLEYAKRSLQHFIDELKNNPPKVTQ
jgi:hypothetical protein